MTSAFATTLLYVSLLLAGADTAVAGTCPIVDVMPEFQSALARTTASPIDQQVVELKGFIAQHRPLFAPDVLGIRNADDFDAVIKSSVPAIRSNIEGIKKTAAVLHEQLPAYLEDFRAVFPDLNCSFTIYMMPSFNSFDGAGRFVDGKPAMVLGVDTITTYEKPDQLKVFIDHEIFHRYHYQVAGFSDDESEAAPIWKALWVEGLATYVSATMNPDRPLADALLLPRDLEARAQPHIALIAAELRASLDRKDSAVFGKFFEYGSKSATAANLPWRAGYYAGYLVAKRLAQDASLPALAQLHGEDLMARIAAALDELAAAPTREH
jgi:hypothetical protein